MCAMNPRLLRPRLSFDPRRIAGLELWLDTSDESRLTLVGSAISEVRDKSGKGWVAEQSTGANRPIFTANAFNGRSAAVFNGANMYMTIPSFSALGEYTAFAVCYRFWSGGLFRAIGSTSYDENQGAVFFLKTGSAIFDWQDNDLVLTGNGFGSGRAPRSIGPISLTDSQPAIFSGKLSPAASGLRINGVNAGTRVNTTGTTTVASATLYFGASLTGTTLGGFWDGGIAEFLIYKAALSDAQIKTVERYLSAKYAITVAA
jgi:hypothetical protein